ncbi:unnamed protein product [Linum trigynum]|uniref:Uncharacterized protein n=1 Tax=Linum trigynum TaxID=586398 RepID=A0AAV2EFQ7_9ROSI
MADVAGGGGDPGLKAFSSAAKLVDRLEMLIENPVWRQTMKIAEARLLRDRLGWAMAAKAEIVVEDAKDIVTVGRLWREFGFKGTVKPNGELPSETASELTRLAVSAYLNL